MREKTPRKNDWKRLIEAARKTALVAYAPYSKLRIGAALEGDEGVLHLGCNVENSSYGLTICAERVAIFRALSEGVRSFRRLVIYTDDADPLSPCGACRQVLAEFSDTLPILSIGRGGREREFQLEKLLPEAFAWPVGNPPEKHEE